MKLKLFYHSLIIYSLLLFLVCCSKDDENLIIENQIINVSPNSFNVSVLRISFSSVTIAWDKVIDPNGDELLYSFYLNDSLILDGIKKDTLLTITGLTPETEYNGIIQVTDSINPPVSARFNFKTPKYQNLFDLVYTNPLGLLGVGAAIGKTSDGGYIISGNIAIGSLYVFVLKIDSLGYEQWSNIYGSTFSSNFEGNIIETKDHGYLLANGSKLIKLNNKGERLWQYPPDDDIGHHYSSVIEMDEGNFLVSGTTYDTVSGTNKASVTKLTNNGDILWIKNIGADGSSARYTCKSHNSDFLAVGNIKQDNKKDIWICEFDVNGVVKWEKTLVNIYDNYAIQIKSDFNDGYYISSNSTGDLDITAAHILKIDNEGGIIWEKYFLWDDFKTYSYGIESTIDGGCVFTGVNGYDRTECLIVKLNNNGEIDFENHIYPQNGQLDYLWYASDIKTTKDGGYIISGYKGCLWSDCSDYERGLWVLKTDVTGQVNF